MGQWGKEGKERNGNQRGDDGLDEGFEVSVFN